MIDRKGCRVEEARETVRILECEGRLRRLLLVQDEIALVRRLVFHSAYVLAVHIVHSARTRRALEGLGNAEAQQLPYGAPSEADELSRLVVGPGVHVPDGAAAVDLDPGVGNAMIDKVGRHQAQLVVAGGRVAAPRPQGIVVEQVELQLDALVPLEQIAVGPNSFCGSPLSRAADGQLDLHQRVQSKRNRQALGEEDLKAKEGFLLHALKEGTVLRLHVRLGERGQLVRSPQVGSAVLHGDRQQHASTVDRAGLVYASLLFHGRSPSNAFLLPLHPLHNLVIAEPLAQLFGLPANPLDVLSLENLRCQAFLWKLVHVVPIQLLEDFLVGNDVLPCKKQG